LTIALTESLLPYGLSNEWARAFESACLQAAPASGAWEIARVLSIHYGGLFVITARGRLLATPSGLFAKLGRDDHRERGAVGDFCIVEAEGDGRATLHGILPRENTLSRQLENERDEVQILCANVDYACIFAPSDRPLEVKSLLRYVAMAKSCNGAAVLLVLSKADLASDIDERVTQLRAELEVPVHAISCMDASRGFELPFAPQKTAAFLGPSGSGKSTLVNALLAQGGVVPEQQQRTQETRESDNKGRHTTTHRELFLLQSGALIIDTPGLREVAPPKTMLGAFPEIQAAAESCRFTDCTHRTEAGCAVLRAVRDGKVAQGRLNAFLAATQPKTKRR
jgi:ribosome biogenesis GTPase / thiamine phosphate phosphatase